MADPNCGRCAKPMRADTASVCGGCASHLRSWLDRTAGLAGQVAVTIARLDRIPAGGTGSPDQLGWWKTGDALEPIALPYNPDAAERYRAAWGELATWARHCCGERGIDYTGGGLEGLCGFLAGQLEWLRHRQEATEAWPAIEDACRQIERIVDRRPDLDLIGLCDCGTAIYARRTDERTVACERCSTEHDVDQLRAAMQDATTEAYVSASTAAAWIIHMGLVRDQQRLRKLIVMWSQRGHIEPMADGRYRFGDILARVMASPALRVA